MSKKILCKVVKNSEEFVQFYGAGWDYTQLRMAYMADTPFEEFLYPDDAEKFADCPEPGADAHVIRIVYADGTIEKIA